MRLKAKRHGSFGNGVTYRTMLTRGKAFDGTCSGNCRVNDLLVTERIYGGLLGYDGFTY
jgi:hypothetical protein